MIQVDGKTHFELVREEVERRILEKAANKIESLAGAEAYVKAWTRAARIIREMKP